MTDNATVVTDVANVIQALAALAAASGFGTWIFSALKKNGIDTQATLNNKWVQAGLRAAESAVTDVVLQGKNPTDPKVIQDVIAAVTSTMNASHGETQKALGAKPEDTTRMVTNAVNSAVKSTMTAPVALTGSTQGTELQYSPNDPITAAKQAQAVISGLREVLNSNESFALNANTGPKV